MASHDGKLVVYACEMTKDGPEDTARIVGSAEEALALISRWKEGFGGRATTCRLFRLGEEIPLRTERAEEPQPAKVTERIVLA